MAEADTYTIFRNNRDTTLRMVTRAGSELPPIVRRENWTRAGSVREDSLPPHDLDEIRKTGFSVYRIEWEGHSA